MVILVVNFFIHCITISMEFYDMKYNFSNNNINEVISIAIKTK